MAVGTRLVSLFTLSSLAVLICSLNATPVSAVSLEINHNARSLHNRAHDALAKRKRSAKKSKRCKPKAAPAPTPAPSSSKADHAPSPSPTNKNNGSKGGNNNGGNSTSSGQSSNNNGGGNIGGSGKTGLAWANGNQDLQKWSAVKTMYTWSPACPDQAEDLGIDCCPMAWGWNQVQQFQDTVNKRTPKCAMGPNEPEIPSQSNMSPQSAAQLWNQYIRPLAAKGVKLVTPACTSDPAGKQWMKDFFAACGGNDNCGATYYAVHYYDVSADNFISFLEDLHNTFNMDMWVTEFACQNFNGGAQCSQDQIWGFQSKITAFFENTPWIKKYFAWGAMHNLQGVNDLNRLMNGDGSINDLGRAYLGL